MIERFATGITGLDEISGGGMPLRRASLIAGEAGCGKTLFLLSILNAALARGEGAVFLSLEERPDAILGNALSIGLDLQPFIDTGTLRIDHVAAPSHEQLEAGQYSLEGLRIRIAASLKAVDAKFIAIDTIETLFALFENERILRSELLRLLLWLTGEGVTTLISGERGEGKITRRGLEEYVSDCVITLDNDTEGEVATRRMRIVKFRGGAHGQNKYPFLIDDQGITILPISSARLDHSVGGERVPTGTEALDTALAGGFRRGSTSLLSGGAGAGKTVLASVAVEGMCDRGERALFLSFEESPEELIANVLAAGVDLKGHRDAGRLILSAARPTLMGLEQHLVHLYRLVLDHEPSIVVIDPLSALRTAGHSDGIYRTAVRMIDLLKRRKVTTLLTMEGPRDEETFGEINISSILDTWVHLSMEVDEDGLKRHLRVVKARGTAHEHRPMSFEIARKGVVVGAGADD